MFGLNHRDGVAQNTAVEDCPKWGAWSLPELKTRYSILAFRQWMQDNLEDLAGFIWTFLHSSTVFCIIASISRPNYQKWSRGHKARGQGHKKISRPRTKDTDASVLQKKGPQNFFSGDLKKKVFKNFFQAKKVFKNFFQAISTRGNQKKRSLQIFRKVSGVFQRNFNGSKIVLSSSQGQGNF